MTTYLSLLSIFFLTACYLDNQFRLVFDQVFLLFGEMQEVVRLSLFVPSSTNEFLRQRALLSSEHSQSLVQVCSFFAQIAQLFVKVLVSLLGQSELVLKSYSKNRNTLLV